MYYSTYDVLVPENSFCTIIYYHQYATSGPQNPLLFHPIEGMDTKIPPLQKFNYKHIQTVYYLKQNVKDTLNNFHI